MFFVGDLVIKFVPPPYLDAAAREAGALRELVRRLPVRTPEVVASGVWGAWRYLVSTRIPGCSVRDSGGSPMWSGALYPSRWARSFAYCMSSLRLAFRKAPASGRPASKRDGTSSVSASGL